MVDHLNDELLSSYVLQTLTDEEREHIDQHLERCPTCRALISGHEATMRRIRYALTADLRQMKPSNKYTFATIAPALSRSRRWAGLKMTLDRGLAASPQLALLAAVVALLIVIFQGTSLLNPQPAAPDLAAAATFENRDLRIFTAQPGLTTGAEDAWDSWWVNPGGAFFDDGKFHMFYSGKSLNKLTASVSVGYANSADGLTWSRESTSPVLTPAALDWPEKIYHLSANSALVEDEQWTLYYTIGQLQSLLSGKIGRATAPSALGPWRADAAPVLLPGSRGEWDAGLVADACVVRDGRNYVMYYTGGVLSKMIGRAVSTDGVTWTKYDDPATTEPPFAESDPVLRADADWEGQSLEDPCVQWAGNHWVMTYVSPSTTGVGYAVSADGIHWLKSPQNPIFVSDLSGENRPMYGATLAIHDHTAFFYFQPDVNIADGRGMYIATWREP
jgi:predicted GH43/DUF377 family glycosyl hydrolase